MSSENTGDPRRVVLYSGRGGDHNARAMTGAPLVAAELSRLVGTAGERVGEPAPPLDTDWHTELDAARPALRDLARRYAAIYTEQAVPVAALTRCAVSLATIPIALAHHPDAVVVWLDAHADIYTPEDSSSGFLGGLVLTGVAGMWDTGLWSEGELPHRELDLASLVLVGVRDTDPAEQRLIDDGTVRAVPVGASAPGEVAAAVGDRPVYVHLDCDVLEPGIVPTDYRVAGGLDLGALRAVAEVLGRNRVVGIEVAEFEGEWADDGGTAVSAAPLVDALAPLIAAAGRAR